MSLDGLGAEESQPDLVAVLIEDDFDRYGKGGLLVVETSRLKHIGLPANWPMSQPANLMVHGDQETGAKRRGLIIS